MRWILLLCFFNASFIQAQVSAIKLTAEDTTNNPWVNTTGFVNSESAFQLIEAAEIHINSNKRVDVNFLGGIQYQKKIKTISLKLAPYFFLNNEVGGRFPSRTDIRVGNLVANTNGYAHKFDVLANLVWKPIKYVKLAIGKGNHQLGKGINSLLWSGNGAPAYFGLAELKTKKISYRAQWNAISLLPEDNIKWIAQHTVTVHLPNEWQISLFEAVIWGAKDSTYNRGFDWQYMAPTVIYRPTEFNGGSADNVILGLDWSGRLIGKIKTYGQLVVDEFLLDEIRKNDGWWANKFGGQFGLSRQSKKHFMQAELNVVRPFTYSHGNTVIAYTNQAVPIGAWNGAGLAEVVGAYKYQVSSKLTFGLMASAGTYKSNSYGNYGANPFQTYNTRQTERNHTIGGGNAAKMIDLTCSMSYLVIPKINGLLTVWAGVHVQEANSYTSSWFQIKLSNTLFSKFNKTNF
jgi:hypothetical protein